jgi:Tfp pilus assembly protein FimT
MRYRTGMTLIEALISVLILSVLVTVSVNVFKRFNETPTVEQAAGVAKAAIEDARGRTLSAKSDTHYGVYLQSDRAVIFPGGTYATGTAENEVRRLPSRTAMSHTLSDSTSQIVFEKGTGSASATGTVTVFISNQFGTSSPTRTLEINKSGLVEVQ